MNDSTKLSSLHKLIVENRFVDQLPGDSETRNFTRQVFGACYSPVTPTPVRKPVLAAYAEEVAQLLDIAEEDVSSEGFVKLFSGNCLLSTMKPYASCYGGHQFGVWAGQLGDGRAINLGEIVNSKEQRWAIQLKGSGLTPYSRTADGRAVLRSSIREFLCSEAMFHLGVPTTRALSLITTGESVVRDMFYNGNPKIEPSAVVCRVAPTFLRFGHYQILAARGDLEILKKLIDCTVNWYFPHLGQPSRETYLAWFEEICRTTAEMVMHWQRVGFVHGVMNTDNMSVLGLTIDYGPYGWLENYDPDWTPNTTDSAERRYRFGNQAACAFWNLAQLANAIYPLIGDAKPLQDALDRYTVFYDKLWRTMMMEKLGLQCYSAKTDDSLISKLLMLLEMIETDMTLFFRGLADIELGAEVSSTFDPERLLPTLENAFYQPYQSASDYVESLIDWLKHYNQRLLQEGITQTARREKMNQVNPLYVLRNYLAQEAIDKAEQNDFTGVDELMTLLRRPYDVQPGKTKFAAKRPEWARQRPGCSMLSCSS